MEPENHWVVEEYSLPMVHVQVMLMFLGVGMKHIPGLQPILVYGISAGI